MLFVSSTWLNLYFRFIRWMTWGVFWFRRFSWRWLISYVGLNLSWSRVNAIPPILVTILWLNQICIFPYKFFKESIFFRFMLKVHIDSVFKFKFVAVPFYWLVPSFLFTDGTSRNIVGRKVLVFLPNIIWAGLRPVPAFGVIIRSIRASNSVSFTLDHMKIDVNCGSPSEIIVSGIPKRAIHFYEIV